jgi:hypothetical protein
MKSAPTSCGFDPQAMREVREGLADGSLQAVFYRPTGRVLYVNAEELAALPRETYTPLKSGAGNATR